HARKGEFRQIEPAAARGILIEGLERVLPGSPPKLSEWARKDLGSMGVEVRTGTMVKSIDDFGVDLDGERIQTRTVLWAAGVRASPIGESLGAELDRSGRVIVEPDLSLPATRRSTWSATSPSRCRTASPSRGWPRGHSRGDATLRRASWGCCPASPRRPSVTR